MDVYDNFPTFDLDDEVEVKPSQPVVEKPIEDVILSDDEVKKVMGFKPEKTTEPKLKSTSLMKIYDYLMDESVQKVLKVNHNKIQILKAIMDFQDGLMDKDTLCDYFIDED